MDADLVEDTAYPTSIGASGIDGSLMTDSLDLDPTLDMDLPPDPPIVPDSRDQALQLLISGAVPQNELASLIETIFSNKVTDVVDRLQGSDVQTFIDVIDEVWRHTLLSSRC
jgi:hypothetical protein